MSTFDDLFDQILAIRKAGLAGDAPAYANMICWDDALLPIESITFGPVGDVPALLVNVVEEDDLDEPLEEDELPPIDEAEQQQELVGILRTIADLAGHFVRSAVTAKEVRESVGRILGQDEHFRLLAEVAHIEAINIEKGRYDGRDA